MAMCIFVCMCMCVCMCAGLPYLSGFVACLLSIAVVVSVVTSKACLPLCYFLFECGSCFGTGSMGAPQSLSAEETFYSYSLFTTSTRQVVYATKLILPRSLHVVIFKGSSLCTCTSFDVKDLTVALSQLPSASGLAFKG